MGQEETFIISTRKYLLFVIQGTIRTFGVIGMNAKFRSR